MLSIIICSKQENISNALARNIQLTVGIDYEIITIDNSKNQFSIFSAYNEGFRRSRFPNLCFVHEDVYFHTQDWGNKLIKHLSNKQTGIIGLAGGRLITRVPSSWSVFDKSMNIIQSDKSSKDSKKHFTPKNYGEELREVLLLDGVLLAMRREIFGAIKFDESLNGFHAYDLDISLQSLHEGYKNFVAYDFEVEHFSKGYRDKKYFENQILVFKKWQQILPINLNDLSNDEIKQIETKRLKQLLHKMIVRKFKLIEIKNNLNYFAQQTDQNKKFKFNYFTLLHIFFVRLLRCPDVLFK